MTSTSRKYDLVVFDWDGTVMDTTGLIAEGIRQAAAALGCRVPDRKTASSVIGLDWRSAMAIAVPDCPAERLDEFNEAYKAWYLPRERDVCLFEGIEDLMRRLHADGVTLAVARGRAARAYAASLTERTSRNSFRSPARPRKRPQSPIPTCWRKSGSTPTFRRKERSWWATPCTTS